MNSNNNRHQKIGLACRADKTVLPRGKTCTRIIEVSITAPTADNENKKPPLNIGLVIDRSGSMQGEKLHYAKQAAVHMIDLLSPADRAAVVMYDDKVDVVCASQPMTAENKTKAKQAIQRISSRGSTFLFGGWLKGSEQVAENDGANQLSRTFLLSDGLANVGLTNIDEIASHSRQLLQRGISTSCFGVGLHYNEHLLEAMSNAGGGNFHFLETMSAIPLAFEREFEELINISLRAVEVQLDLPDGAKCDISAGWHSQQDDRTLTASIGSLNSGQEQRVYFQFHLEKNTRAETLEIPIRVQGKTIDGAGLEANEILSFRFVEPIEEQGVDSDPALMERFALVDMADRATEALRRARAGDRAGAQDMLYQRMIHHSQNMTDSTVQKYTNMVGEINKGMDESSFKRRHQEEYERKRSHAGARDYHLRLVNGHLFVSIQGQNVLIDTGVPVSIGNQPTWYFNHEVHQLSQSYLGVTIPELSRLVGAPIDILMGCDILKKLFVTLDLRGKRVSFYSQPNAHGGPSLEMRLFMGVPFVDVEAGGTVYEMFVDTGAKLSYIGKEIAESMMPVGMEKDFYPGLGEFETPVYEVPLRLGGHELSLRCGVLPDVLEATMKIAGKRGIIGAQLFEKFQVHLAFPDNAMFLRE